MNSVAQTKKTLPIGQVLSESWHLVSGLKWPVFCVLFWIVIGRMLGVYIKKSLFVVSSSGLLSYLGTVPTLIITNLIFCVAVILGVRRAIGLPVEPSLALLDCWRVKGNVLYLTFIGVCWSSIFLAVRSVLSQSMMASLPVLYWPTLIFVILVYQYFGILIYLFALPLIVTKRCPIQYALESGWVKMKQHGFNVMVCFIIINIIILLSAIPLGIGLIWTIPLLVAFFGVVFRNVYGLRAKPANAQ